MISHRPGAARPARTRRHRRRTRLLQLPQPRRRARDNPKQGALDDFQLLRLVKAIDVAAAPTTGAPIKFDPARIYFKGHSQGGLTGPLFLAAEPEVKAAVLSGAGGDAHLRAAQQDRAGQHPAVVRRAGRTIRSTSSTRCST